MSQFYLLFFAHLLILTASSYTVMLIVWGEPETHSGYETFDSWDDCLDECYDSDDCVLVHQVSSGCWLFRFGNVSTVRESNRTDGKIIGFRKTTNSTTCSSMEDLPIFGTNSTSETYISNQTLYNSTITYESGSWTITYTIFVCPNNTKMFERESVTVCIGVRVFSNFNFTTFANYSSATSLCSRDGGMSLTGPYSSDESTYLMAQVTPRIWIDGISSSTAKVFEMEDDTHNGTSAYPMATSQPDGTNHPMCLSKVKSHETVDDIVCTDKLYGAMCRVELVAVD